jgi:hypothetical protein
MSIFKPIIYVMQSPWFVKMDYYLGKRIFDRPFVIHRICGKIGWETYYTGPVIEFVHRSIEAFRAERITDLELINQIKDFLSTAGLEHDLRAFLSLDPGKMLTIRLYRKYLAKSGNRIELNVFYIPAGQCHPPHMHHDTASVQLCLAGKLRARQYDRIQREDDNHVRIRPVLENTIGLGDCMVTGENYRNVHWFGSLDEPSIVLNLNIGGLYEDTFDDKADDPRGFLDVERKIDQDGSIVVKRLSSVKAHEKYAKTPLNQWPISNAAFTKTLATPEERQERSLRMVRNFSI